MSRHTPGPWHASGSEVYAEYVCNGTLTSRWIATVEAGEGDKPKQIDYANARLIAAAPDLLEQLTQTVRALEYWFPQWGDPDGVNSQMMSNAREAIAKAEGRGEK